MSPLLEAFHTYLSRNHLMHPDFDFIVATSGGVDSVGLCELCYQAGLFFFISPFNFCLRGAENDRGEVFLKNLAERYRVSVFVKRFDTEQYGLLKKLSTQEAARELRYQWFEELRQEIKASHVLLAHHANDNVETVLMNLFRGTGFHGLTGMP